jgi:hypothetical protein
MTDRELLELAAKAAGIDARRLPHAWSHRFDDDQWDPLIDNGDALRLAVQLQIDVNHGDVIVVAERVGPVEAGVAEPKQSDPYAATRRAIVRAAAEIGRNM